ncbi:MAG: glycosyltransferase family 9 protein [Microthrixaceae bacterium]
MPNEFTLKLTDRWLEPASSAVGRFVGRRASVFRRPVHRDLLVRPGGLGDTVILHLAVRALGLDPQSFTWLVGDRGRLWVDLQGLPSTSNSEGSVALVREVAGRYDTVINTEQRFGLSQSICRAASRTGGRIWCFATNRAAKADDSVVSYRTEGTHEVYEFMRLLGRVYALDVPERIEVPRAHPADGPAVVALGGSHAPSRDFQARQWVEWIERLKLDDVILAHGPAEAELADRISELLPGAVAERSTSFLRSVDAISRASHLLTVDGGLLHVGSFYGVPTTAVFTAGRWDKWRPLADGSEVVRRTDVGCQPCTLFGETPTCTNALLCMRLRDDDWEAAEQAVAVEFGRLPR